MPPFSPTLPPIQLTDAARKFLDDQALLHGLGNFAIRIRTVGADLAKHGFDLAFEDFPRADDIVLRVSGIVFHVAPDTLERVRGLIIDHGPRGFVFRQAPTELPRG